MVRVLIADDHAVVRQGLRQILAEQSGNILFAEACNAREVVENVRGKDFDILMLDITLPDRSGLAVLKEVKNIRPKLPVLVLSIHPEDQYAVRVLKLGAAGYMTKESAPEELVEAVSKVLGGGKYVSASLAEKLAADLHTSYGKRLHEILSDREYQVMCMIASGKRTKEIAGELYLSVKTVGTYRTRIFEKMKMKTNVELAHYAIKNHLVD